MVSPLSFISVGHVFSSHTLIRSLNREPVERDPSILISFDLTGRNRCADLLGTKKGIRLIVTHPLAREARQTRAVPGARRRRSGGGRRSSGVAGDCGNVISR
ncbi:hypothetical protein EVAR_28533_1 [Eumeta japonica]|uniref:Uncharacterized protein n=1 Tax=Eumeta variegata TaxID=151549 RepID=A0A4C1UYN1_EUMVA|nr:hypothetical protein EVAR_28533_1 [Eumeta japonica]